MKHSEIWWSPKVIPDWILPSTLIFSHWILWTPSFKCGCSSPLFLVVEWNNQWGNYLLKYNIITIITCRFPLSTAPDLSLSLEALWHTLYSVIMKPLCRSKGNAFRPQRSPISCHSISSGNVKGHLFTCRAERTVIIVSGCDVLTSFGLLCKVFVLFQHKFL